MLGCRVREGNGCCRPRPTLPQTLSRPVRCQLLRADPWRLRAEGLQRGRPLSPHHHSWEVPPCCSVWWNERPAGLTSGEHLTHATGLPPQDPCQCHSERLQCLWVINGFSGIRPCLALCGQCPRARPFHSFLSWPKLTCFVFHFFMACFPKTQLVSGQMNPCWYTEGANSVVYACSIWGLLDTMLHLTPSNSQKVVAT